LVTMPLRGGDETIPTLSDVLALVAGRVPMLIEIKDQDGEMGASVGPLETSVAAALANYSGPVAVMSFNPHSVMKMAELLPDVPRGLVTGSYDAEKWGLPAKVCDRLRGIPDYDRAGCGFVSHEHQDLQRSRVAELKSAGAKILCWTVKSPAEEATARKIADNITFEQYLAPFPG
ncbi:MAG: glycerophosphodiester phosphodiesterase family protein, partial [Roseobacter sp.]